MRRVFLVLGLILGVSAGNAMEVKDVPNPRVERGSYVQDSAGLLSDGERTRLDVLSMDLESKAGAELAFVTIDNLEGESVEEFANKLFKRFGIGKKAKDNGILVLVARDNRRFRVEVGYGLEAVLPDALCKRLMDQLAVPHFKAGQFGTGLYDLGFALASKVAQSENVVLSTAANIPAEPSNAGDNQVLTFVYSSPRAEESSGPPWWVWINGPLIFGFTALFIAWRTLRFHLSASLAGKRLALGRDGTDFPGKVVGVGVFGTIIFTGAVGAFLPILSMAIGSGLTIGLFRLWRNTYLSKAEAYRRTCRSCSQPMQVIAERDDDRFLKENEIDEESAEGMDYEFWRCGSCLAEERFDVKLPYATKCAQCGFRSLVTTDTVVSAATYSSSGKRKIDKNCKYRQCRFAETTYKTIPKKTRSSSSSGGGGGGGGGSFGGGSSGGGGASGGW